MTTRRAGWVPAASFVLRLAVSVALLVAVARTLDVGGVLLRLTALRPAWVAVGLAISVVQVSLLAWRWRFTAGRLGIDLPPWTALSEYYLGLMLNQVLPGGVTGDAARAYRHARTEASRGAAVRAVVLERASAQVVMATVAGLSVLLLPLSGHARLGIAAAAVAVGAAVVVAGLRRRSGSDPSPAPVTSGESEDPAAPPPETESLTIRALADLRVSVLAREALPFQLLTALLVIGSYVAVYLVAARAIGVDTPALRLLPLIAPVLMTMLVPVTIAGWGIRESAAAALWGSVGLTAEEGVAISVAYGVLVLVSSAPGLVVLTRLVVGAGRGRTARRRQGGSTDRPDGAPARASRSDRG